MKTFELKFNNIMKKIKADAITNLSELVDLYRVASPEERDYIRKNTDNEIAYQLILYSHKASIECVRKKSKEILLSGLLAQSIEDSRADYRDNLTHLFLLYNSAKRIGEDPNILIKEMIKISSKDFGKLLYDFLGRDDLDEDPVKLSGYKVVETPEFDYVWAG